jgi:hypothetical protein
MYAEVEYMQKRVHKQREHCSQKLLNVSKKYSYLIIILVRGISIQIVLMAGCRISRVFTTGIVSTVILSMRETGLYIELDMK